MPLRSTNEKRKSARVPLLNEIRYRIGESVTRKRLVDLSVDGVFIDTADALPVGTEMVLEFSLPKNRQVRVRGYVRYHQAGVGMGIQFVDLPEADRAAIAEYIGQLA